MNWWLEHGLDGLVGGLVGGLATALAVWLTLRHERRLTRENSAIDTAARLFPAVLQYSQELLSDASGWSVGAVDRELHAIIWELLAKTERLWPNFKARLRELDQDLLHQRQALLDASDEHRQQVCMSVRNCLDEIFLVTATWVEAPDRLERQRSKHTFRSEKDGT